MTIARSGQALFAGHAAMPQAVRQGPAGRSAHTAEFHGSHVMAATPSPGSTALVRIPGLELECDSFATRALTLTAQPDGHATLAAAAIEMQGVRATMAGARIDIQRMMLEDVRAEVAPIAGAPAITSLVARHVVVEHLQAALARGSVAAGDASQSLQLDALRTLDGLLHAYVTDALWFADADVAVPIKEGTVDFNAIVIENIGPNSLMGVSSAGIHVSGPAGQVRVPLVTFPSPPPGVSFGTDGGFPFARGDRGRIDLLPFLHALLESPPGQPPARLADAKLSSALARTRVKGEVQLGDGALARGGQRIELAGRADGKNRCTLDSSSVAQRMTIGVPQFAAAAASLALPGRALRVAALSARVEAHVLGHDAPPDSPGLLLSIEHANLQDVAMVPVG